MHSLTCEKTWIRRFMSVLLSFTLLPGGGLMGFNFRISVAQDHNTAAQIPSSAKSETTSKNDKKPQLIKNYGNTAIAFEGNLGQARNDVKFLSRGKGYELFLTESEAVLFLEAATGERKKEPDSSRQRNDIRAVAMSLVGSNPNSHPIGVQPIDGKTNYLLGNDSSKWVTDVPKYARVSYEHIYPGIDMIYKGLAGEIEFDFTLAPYADPDLIKLRYQGAKKLSIDKKGDLKIELIGGTLVQHKPKVYQRIDGNTKEISARYRLISKHCVSLAIDKYDESQELVIDPTLTYSTYLGGSRDDKALAVAVDSLGNAYVAGITLSTDFPIANALQPSHAGSNAYYDAFITKLSADGSVMLYSTYLGGSTNDQPNGIAVDASGAAYVTGNTDSTNFPTANPLQSANGGGADAFVTKLNPSGSSLSFSTYLGGSNADFGAGIALNSNGEIYLTGYTQSSNFPIANAIRPTFGGGTCNTIICPDAFVTKINATGSALVYSTFLGGNNDDRGAGIAVDTSGAAFVSGTTQSTNFPTASALQPSLAGSTDGFITAVNSTGTSFIYSTYLGGQDADSVTGIAVDNSANVYLTGSTASANFPLVNPYQSSLHNLSDAFVTKIAAGGVALLYSTFLGGTVDSNGPTTDNEGGSAIVVEPASGEAYVTGYTDRNDFPLVNPIQNGFVGGWEIFATRFASNGTIIYSTYIGGSGQDVAYAISLDPTGGVVICGMTISTNFPTLNPIQPANAGGSFSFTPMDGFVLKISNADGVQISGQITDSGGNPIQFVRVALTGTESTQILTDAGGHYSFPNLVPGGSYTLTPTKTNYTFTPPTQPLNNVTSNQTINFVGSVASVTINGRVIDGNNAGVSGVTITLSGSQTGSMLTDATGNYSFSNLNAGGTYTITPSRNASAFTPVNKTFTNLGSNQTVDFTLVYAISGTVTDGGGLGTGGIAITLSGPQNATTQTDSLGNYTFASLPANLTYTVTPSKLSYTVTYNFNPVSRSLVLSSNLTGNFSFTTSTNVALNPTADSYVEDGGNANTNFGATTPLLVKTANQTGQRRDAYFKFDLSAVTRNINSVKLRIYAALSASGSVATSVYSVADTSWDEAIINWNNKPARSASALTGATATVNSTTYSTYDLDVTTYVKGEKTAGRDIVSLSLHDPSNSTPNIFLNSREAVANKPQLIVITSDTNNAPPSITLSTPTNGAAFAAPATVSLTASASDADGTVSKVEYYAGTTLVGSSATSPYSVSWTNVPAGSYSLVAVATDNNGAASVSAASNIAVNVPNSLPTVNLISPLTNTTYGPGANISLSANATDIDGTINKVEFFAGANLIGTATTPTSGSIYSVSWNNVAVGAYSVTAKATDNILGTTTSAPITINVVGSAGLSPTADAYVRDGASAGTNFGTATDLQSQVSSSGSNRESYLRFDLTTVTAITRARLRVYGKLSDTSGTNVPVGVYSVANTTWIESGTGSITWNNKPVSSGSTLASLTVPDTTSRWYEFDVSSYIQSEKTAGHNLVSFALKSLTASNPYVTFNSREAINNRPQLVLWTTQPRNVLFAVGSTNLNAGDTAVKTRLQNLGFTVTVKLAGTNNNAINTVDADGKALVVISSTVTPANVTNKFRFVPVPVLTWEFDLLDDMGMTGLTSGTDFGTTSTAQTSLSIVTPGHVMAAGLSGTVTVVTAGSNFTWGVPNANAAKIASLSGDAAKSSIFSYETGATMPGLDAPARRVGAFMTDLTAGSFNTNGGALFDAAVKWATDVATFPTITSLNPNSGPIGTTVTVSGYNFGTSQGTSTVTFNGVPSAPSMWTDSSIVLTVPVFASSGPVIVSVNGVSSNALTFTVGEVDTDADGLPDWWEIQYFGNLSQTASGDPDGDGLTNIQEFQQGRNPTKSAQADDGTGVNLKVYTPLGPPNQ